MTQFYPAYIMNFDHSLFVSIMMKMQDDDNNLKAKLSIIPYPTGITDQEFINECYNELSRFKEFNEFNEISLENYYKIKFCYLHALNKELQPKKIPIWGKNVIFVMTRYVTIYNTCP